MGRSSLELTVKVSAPDADEEELDKQVRSLLNDLRQMPEVESANRVVDPNPPKRHKSSGNFLIDLLTVDVSPMHCLKVIRFLGDRLGNKPLRLKVKAPDGSEIDLEASSREEFVFVMQQAQEFLAKK